MQLIELEQLKLRAQLTPEIGHERAPSMMACDAESCHLPPTTMTVIACFEYSRKRQARWSGAEPAATGSAGIGCPAHRTACTASKQHQDRGLRRPQGRAASATPTPAIEVKAHGISTRSCGHACAFMRCRTALKARMQAMRTYAESAASMQHMHMILQATIKRQCCRTCCFCNAKGGQP